MNDLLKFGYPKEDLKKNLKEIHKYVDKVDSFSLYEYLTEQMDAEAFEQAMQLYSPKKKKPVKKTRDVDGFVPSVNPDRMCVFTDNSPWSRCKYCNSIKKYMKDKECPRFKDNISEDKEQVQP